MTHRSCAILRLPVAGCAHTTPPPVSLLQRAREAARDLERRPELPVHERDRGRAGRARSPRLVAEREGLAATLAAETTPLDENERWWVWKCPTKGCPGLLHAAGYAADLHAVFVVCDGTCGKTFLR